MCLPSKVNLVEDFEWRTQRFGSNRLKISSKTELIAFLPSNRGGGIADASREILDHPLRQW